MSEYKTLQENQSLNFEYERNKKEREMKEEIERLNNIIKEVREYITSQKLHKLQDTTGGLTYQEIKLLEILDKGE